MRNAVVLSLARRLGPRAVLAGGDARAFLSDWRGVFSGEALCVVQPAATHEVAEAVRICAEHSVGIVPQGGNTGLCGGAVPCGEAPQVLLSLNRMRRVRTVAAGAITAEAGCTLFEVQEAARMHGRLFPLSLASEGSARVGGFVSTNAGGNAVLRYGTARDLALGLEVVLPDGSIWDGLRALRKDNAGYDLKQLFIGAEGTLGVITAATLKLFPAVRSRCTALAALLGVEQATSLLDLVQEASGPRLSAFEAFSSACLDMTLEHGPCARRPFGDRYPWYVLLELSDSWADAPLESMLEACFAAAIEKGLVADVIVAQSESQAAGLWAYREHISEAQKAAGLAQKHDVSVPVSDIPAFLAEIESAVEASFPGTLIAPFGHFGDGNIHLNMRLPALPGALQAERALARLVYETVTRFAGSISAEHGIGQLKVGELRRFKSPVALEVMAAVKKALDPGLRMNPGKVLDFTTP